MREKILSNSLRCIKTHGHQGLSGMISADNKLCRNYRLHQVLEIMLLRLSIADQLEQNIPNTVPGFYK